MTEIILCERTTLGTHIPLQRTLYDTLRWGVDRGMYTIQIFVGSTMSFNRTKFKDEDIVKSKEYINIHGLNVFTHLPYIINCCGSITLKKKASELEDKCSKVISYELNLLEKLNNKNNSKNKTGCVLHVGSWKDKEVGIQEACKILNNVDYPKNTYLCLEYMVGRGTILGSTFEELKMLLDGIGNKNVKICLDTAHIQGNGAYDLSKISEVDRMIEDFIKTFGSLEKLGLIHLNDSELELGSGRDLHEWLGKGEIWKHNQSGLIHILNFIQKHNIPTVLETSPDNYIYAQTI